METSVEITKRYIQQLKELLDINVEIKVFYKEAYEDMTKGDLIYLKGVNENPYFYVTGEDNKFISSFTLGQMPGCCGICISTAVLVDIKYRNKGVNTILNNFRIELARYLGYGLLLCTDIADNLPEVKTLDKNGWEHIYNFNNPRTGNDLNISVKPLLC